MIDRYLFRGFHKDENGTETIYLNGEEVKGKWYFGSLLKFTIGYQDKYYIVLEGTCYNEIYDEVIKENLNAIWEEQDFFETIPDTISQYTGLDDKNGVRIFENDDIEFSYDYFTGDFDTKVGKGIVKFIDGIFYIVPYEIEDKKVEDIENGEWFPIYHVNLEELEVLKTIFDEKEVK